MIWVKTRIILHAIDFQVNDDNNDNYDLKCFSLFEYSLNNYFMVILLLIH